MTKAYVKRDAVNGKLFCTREKAWRPETDFATGADGRFNSWCRECKKTSDREKYLARRPAPTRIGRKIVDGKLYCTREQAWRPKEEFGRRTNGHPNSWCRGCFRLYEKTTGNEKRRLRRRAAAQRLCDGAAI